MLKVDHWFVLLIMLKNICFNLMEVIKKILIFPIVLLVKIYQYIISPIFPASCRYTPTCSNYMLEALKIWGPLKGTYLGLIRILSCHPWGKHGDDPVPQKPKSL
jgi:uncharacterized protein